MDDVSRAITIYPRHHESFGIRWRCNKKHCTCPSELAPHKTLKGDRGITLFHSEKVFRLTKVLVHVSTPTVGNNKRLFRYHITCLRSSLLSSVQTLNGMSGIL